jgi:hypothetical protein
MRGVLFQEAMTMDWFPSWHSTHQHRRRLLRIRRTHRPILERLEDRLAPSVNVFGYHNNNANLGYNVNETILTPANVNVNTFGKLFTSHVDGQVYAQPLYVSNAMITTGSQPEMHNVVYVATQHDSLFALDADNGKLLWQDSFIKPDAGVTTIPSTDIQSLDINPEIGITSTPVIDPARNTLYLVASTKEVVDGANHYVDRLHAIDLGNGMETLGGPTTIADTIYDGVNYTYVSGPSVAGTGAGSVNGRITLNVVRQGQRSGLILSKGSIYIAFASHNDNPPFHGWILGYSEQHLRLNGVFNTTPNGFGGGTWMGGGRIATDLLGNFYFNTGNGTFDTTLNSAGFPSQGNFGTSTIKLAIDRTTTPSQPGVNGWGFKVVDYFTPFNQAALSIRDLDLGSGGVILLPDSVGSTAHPHQLITAGKEGRIYLIDRDNMGHFNASGDKVVQEALVTTGSYNSPAYLNGTFYYADLNAPALAFSIRNGAFNPVPTSKSADTFTYPGSTPSISSNGMVDRIVWLLDRASNQLRAYDGLDLGTELYTSAQAPNGRDRIGALVKFGVPTVANGKVYIGTLKGVLTVYGLLSHVNAPDAAAISTPPDAVLQTNQTTKFKSTTTMPSGRDSRSLTPHHVDGFFSSRPASSSARALGRTPVRTHERDWLSEWL